ncbi:MAG: ankyrin repeat domain-containing protein [Candidatus Sericytochromatia bacterium]
MMRKPLLSVLFLLSACSTPNPATPNVQTAQNAVYEAQSRLYDLSDAADPEQARRQFDQAMAIGAVNTEYWVFPLEGALQAGNQELFRYFAAKESQIPGAKLKDLGFDLLAAAAAYKDSSMLAWLLEDPEWKSLGFTLAEKPSRYGPDYIYPVGTACSAGCTTVYQSEPGQEVGYESVLMHAVSRASLTNLEWMLQHGASLDTLDTQKANVLNYAVASKRQELVDFFLQKGLKLNPDKSYPPLLTAVSNYDKEMFLYLLAKGANLDAASQVGDWDPTGDSGLKSTVLSLALQSLWNFDLFRTVLEKGATPDKAVYAGALHNFLASAYFYEENEKQALELLLKYKPNLEVRDAQGRTPLQKFILANNGRSFEIFERLIEAGADIRAADNHGKTVLMYAAEANSLPYLELLFARGIGPDLGVKDLQGRTARDYAASYGPNEAARYLESIPRL